MCILTRESLREKRDIFIQSVQRLRYTQYVLIICTAICYIQRFRKIQKIRFNIVYYSL